MTYKTSITSTTGGCHGVPGNAVTPLSSKNIETRLREQPEFFPGRFLAASVPSQTLSRGIDPDPGRSSTALDVSLKRM